MAEVSLWGCSSNLIESPGARRPPPSGTVTFLFSDIEGSTVRWDDYRSEMQDAVRRHDELIRAAIERNGGYVFKTIGDAFCTAFATVPEAVAAALDAQRAIESADWSAVGGLRVRMAIHAGVADERNADYFGPTVNRVARLLAVGHGGQVLLSGAARDLAREMLPAQATVLDLGLHHLKDLSAPEHVFQLHAPDLTAEFPTLLSLDALPHNLPVQLTPLIGRDEELREIKALIEQSRVVTLIGAGGIGKTRTALQVAADLLHGDGDGVWLVDFASLDDPMLVPSAIAEVFNVADEGGSRRLIDRVGAALRAKKLLIVLDNCEHVLSAASDAATALLRACPEIHLLATSREPLGITGEQSYRMPTLPVPPEGETMTAQRVGEYAAAALFVARARAAQHTFVLTDENAAIVADIVRRLDGIALAIELAAPRIKVLSLSQLDQRLDERFKLLTGGRAGHSRQKTLHALIGWSYDLLSEAERSLLRQSAIFRGGWTLEAAEAICIDERFPDWDALDLLSSLVDKSLVAVEIEGDEQRYRLLESTRQFALGALEEAGEREDAAARHGRYFAGLAQRAHDEFWQVDAGLWTAQARRELENYRAAVGWGLGGEGDAAAGATIVANLRNLWSATARREGRMLCERAAAVLGGDAPESVRGRLALVQAALSHGSASAAAATEAVRLLSGGDAFDRTEALNLQAGALGRAGRQNEAIALYEQALAAARATRAPRLIGNLLTQLGYWNGALGERARARALYDEAAVLLRACNDRRRLASLQLNRAELLFAEGDIAGALADAREGEAYWRERSAEALLCGVLLNAAAYLLALGRFEEAWTSAREGLELALRGDDGYWVAVAIGHLAQLAAETGDPQRAARLLGYANAVYQRMGSVREPTEARGYDRALELILATLPEDRIAALTAQGTAMEQDGAVAEAMAISQPAASHASQSA
jgi:predicted ATPase/class 3 adenylate cyclase